MPHEEVGAVKVKRRRSPRCAPDVDAMHLFEQTVIAMCRERGLHKTMTPREIEKIVRVLLCYYTGTLEELSLYIEDEDWDELVALAKQEQTRRLIRGGR